MSRACWCLAQLGEHWALQWRSFDTTGVQYSSGRSFPDISQLCLNSIPNPNTDPDPNPKPKPKLISLTSFYVLSNGGQGRMGRTRRPGRNARMPKPLGRSDASRWKVTETETACTGNVHHAETTPVKRHSVRAGWADHTPEIGQAGCRVPVIL